MKSRFAAVVGRRRQGGLSLLVGLIMLIMLTLLGISAFNTSNISLRILGNSQVRQESIVAAQTAIEQVLSTPDFVKAGRIPPEPVADISVTLNKADYTVKFDPQPKCIAVVDIPSDSGELDPKDPEDFKCISGVSLLQSGVFITGAPAPTSYCSNTRWAVTADVADPNTSAKIAVEQGVAVRISKANALTYCP